MKPLQMQAMLLMPFSGLIRLVESFLFVLVRWYDAYLYSPLQTLLWPWVEQVPRFVEVKGRKVNVFTANIVTWSRTLLVIPIAYTLKYQCYWTGFLCVIFHDFLDHLDGIVAKVHRHQYGECDDPIVGGFMDAFCDKIVNVLSLWSILMVTDFSSMTSSQSLIYILPCAIIIAYEFTLGVVRVQDFFRAYYFREFKKTDHRSTKTSTAAIMEGKLKEKLESMGIAALCLAQSNPVVLNSISGIIGVTCLVLSVRLAHSSLASKLMMRAPQIRSQMHASDDEDEMKSHQQQQQHQQHQQQLSESRKEKDMSNAWSQTEQPMDLSCFRLSRQSSVNLGYGNPTQYSSIRPDDNDDNIVTESNKSGIDSELDANSHSLGLDVLKRCASSPETAILSMKECALDARVERVYTVGCFDLFHQGHIILMERMRAMGKKVVVGVHDSRSIYQLKKRVPIDSTMIRMRNVRKYADEVFCVAGTDPAPFIDCIFDSSHSIASAIYVRGDDMRHFPARHLCERLMTVKFLPYTQGVSSTKLRKDLLNSSNADKFRLDDHYNDLHMFY